MSSPFLDTTEYFMNKIIQRQEIVPPWIEKQQEVVAAAARFRGRLRADWRRHAARLIASRGGSLDAQMRQAEQYARAEELWNSLGHRPGTKEEKKEESLDSANGGNHRHASQISPSGELRPPRSIPEAHPQPQNSSRDPTSTSTSPLTPLAEEPPPSPPPFRDPPWETAERGYHTTAIASLNTLTRSYNLMAPDLAKKPYFSLDRELRACYADVAPTLAAAIRERATAAAPRAAGSDGGKVGGLFNGGKAGAVRVADERRGKQYGLREFLRDMWGGRKEVRERKMD